MLPIHVFVPPFRGSRRTALWPIRPEMIELDDVFWLTRVAPGPAGWALTVVAWMVGGGLCLAMPLVVVRWVAREVELAAAQVGATADAIGDAGRKISRLRRGHGPDGSYAGPQPTLLGTWRSQRLSRRYDERESGTR
jgi:hypothetical protein